MLRLFACVLALVLPAVGWGQSALAPCPTTGLKHNCYGSHTWPNGEKYVGEYQNGQRHGRGTHTWPNGRKYDGEYRSDMHHGQGTLTLPSGEKYIGEFLDNRYHGQGTLTWSSGEKYIGEFREDMPDGKGIRYGSNGAVIQSGRFAGGTLVQSDPLNAVAGVSKPTIENSEQCAPTHDDYPAAAFLAKAEGTTRIRFTVNATGRLSNAEVVSPAGATREHRQLDRVALSKLSECKFRAGISENRTPLAGQFEVGFVWRLPPAPVGFSPSGTSIPISSPSDLAAVSRPAIGNVSACAPKNEDYPAQAAQFDATGVTRIRFTVGQTGSLTNAEVVKPSGVTRFHRMLDRVALAKLSECKFSAGVSAEGKAIGGSFEVEYVWKLSGPPGGRGEYKFPDGSLYSGAWVNGEPHGLGTSSLPNGETYIGEWRNGKQHGRGRNYTISGSLYNGEFLNGSRHGSGIEYSPLGVVIQAGSWKDGRLTSVNALDASMYPFVPRATPNRRPSDSETVSAATSKERQPSEQVVSEVETERRKRQDLEQRLAAAEARERERLTAEARDRERLSPPIPNVAASIRTAHALVIGNAAYPGSGRLDNPVNDATAISQKLRAMGFTVTTVTDANRQRLVQAMSQFRRTAASADMSLLFYSGHGVQVFGKNYMLPIDMDQTDVAQATIQGVSLNEVVENFLPGKTKLVFLDACRDNPLQRTGDRSVSRGLAPISVAEGTLIAYATKDGQVASDGTGQRNSPFTQALLEHLSDPSDIAVVLRKVREKVMRATGGKQQPWEYGSLTGGELVLSAIRPQR